MEDDLLSILDEIDIAERQMLHEKNRKKAAEILILDRLSYDALKYELGYSSKNKIDIYHGYKITITDSEFEKCIRFV
jgi:hypothetical protein